MKFQVATHANYFFLIFEDGYSKKQKQLHCLFYMNCTTWIQTP